MRVGFIGPAEGDVNRLRTAAEFLLTQAKVDRAVYLGNDDALDELMALWAPSTVTSGDYTTHILDRATALACEGTPAEIEALLKEMALVHDLGLVRKLPPPPGRAVELVDDRIITAVYDKAVLNEEDIANSSVLVYGRGNEPFLKRFGPRMFFTPGPLALGKYGLVALEPDGQVILSLLEASGAVVFREAIQGHRASKMKVS